MAGGENVRANGAGLGGDESLYRRKFLHLNERFPAWPESPPNDILSSLAELAGHAMENVPEEIVADAERWMTKRMARQQRADRQ